ncbi:MAG: ATP-grasp domain-containing protein [Limosilactobacillus mucosae]
MSSTNALYPGATLGIIGLDRNGSTLITAAKRAGFNVGVYVDHAQPSLTKQADFTISGAYNNQEKLTMFAQTCDAIIYANDLIDSSVLRYLSRDTYLPQGVNALEIIQDRLMERAFLDQINVNVAPYVTVISLDDVYQSIDSIGYPAILKPIQRGIGEQSMRIVKQSDITRAADFINAGTYLLESWIDHTAEYTMLAATDGENVQVFPAIELMLNTDEKLLGVKTPANLSADISREMERIVTSVAENLQYRGVFRVDFYVTATGNLYVHGIEPGLSTYGNVFDYATNVSQTEQLLRAIAGMPLFEVQTLQPTVMMLARVAQRAALQRQWLLKDNWHYRFFTEVREDPQAVAGFVWAVGKSSLEELQHQIEDTEVWNEKASTDSNPAPDQQ